MLEIQSIFDEIKANDKYDEKTQVLTFLLHTFGTAKKPPTKDDLAAIEGFIFEEMKKLIALIPKTEEYRMKDSLFAYEDIILGLLTLLVENKSDVSEENFEIVKTLVNLVAEAQILETAIDQAFELEKIDKIVITKIIDIVNSITDEYQRGKLYHGLLYHKESIDKVTDEAKSEIAEYIGTELERYLKKKDSLTEDEINNLEVAADVCQFFITAKIVALLKEILKLKYNNIRYYTISSLLEGDEEIEAGFIAEIAKDLVYAELTYSLLKRYGIEELFPKEFATPEYLAKSDMVHWLTYPTELGKEPDAIELLGSEKVKGELYYIFKYMSDSGTLDDESKNTWLIGWSSNDGGTFSNFDKLSLYEQKNLQKTLKYIKKKLIG